MSNQKGALGWAVALADLWLLGEGEEEASSLSPAVSGGPPCLLDASTGECPLAWERSKEVQARGRSQRSGARAPPTLRQGDAPAHPYSTQQGDFLGVVSACHSISES